jgi:apolipoprotein N-acyltransferase
MKLSFNYANTSEASYSGSSLKDLDFTLLRSGILTQLIVLLAGALLTLSFAPFNLFPLAIISPAILLSALLTASPKRAFWLGWLFGVGLFTTGVYWIFISVHVYGNTSYLIATLATAALVSILSLYTGLQGYLLTRFFPTNNLSKLLLAFPALWVTLEWLRGWFLSGFPWLFIGYSQITSPLKSYAPLLSVYGVSFITVLSGSLLLLTLLCLKQKRFKQAITTSVLFTLLWIGGAALSLIPWITPSGHPIKISLVQGNIAQELKWSEDHIQPTLDRYVDLTRDHWDSQIIIWPESAVPLPKHYAQNFLDKLAEDASRHKVTVITGIPIKATEESGYYNGVIALGNGEGLYTKQQLVPFGEYIPFRRWLGHLMDLLKVPMSDFVPGHSSMQPLLANGMKIAAFVCYEITYPEQVRKQNNDIDFILTVSNDAWFGESIAQAQHVEMAEMRALEMGRPVLFVANDGITAIINPLGKIQSIVPQHETVVLTDHVQAFKGTTPWHVLGMYPIYFICLLSLTIAFLRRKKS